MKQIKVAITDETKAYLDEQAQKNGRNLSEEVRVRMEQSQVDDRFDAVTKELAKDIMWLAHLVTEGFKRSLPEGATWATDERLFEVLKVAIDTWMTDLADRLDLQSLSEGARLDAVTLGKSNARSYAHLKPMLIKHTPGGDNMEGKR
jgi:hypothetical protein